LVRQRSAIEIVKEGGVSGELGRNKFIIMPMAPVGVGQERQGPWKVGFHGRGYAVGVKQGMGECCGGRARDTRDCLRQICLRKVLPLSLDQWLEFRINLFQSLPICSDQFEQAAIDEPVKGRCCADHPATDIGLWFSVS